MRRTLCSNERRAFPHPRVRRSLDSVRNTRFRFVELPAYLYTSIPVCSLDTLSRPSTIADQSCGSNHS